MTTTITDPAEPGVARANARLRENRDAILRDPPDPDLLCLRVDRATAAWVLCMSDRKLGQLIRDGRLPVIRPAGGRHGDLIEAREIRDFLIRQRNAAHSAARHRRAVSAAHRK